MRNVNICLMVVFVSSLVLSACSKSEVMVEQDNSMELGMELEIVDGEDSMEDEAVVFEGVDLLDYVENFKDYMIEESELPRKIEEVADLTVDDCAPNVNGVCSFNLAVLVSDDEFYLRETAGGPGSYYGPFTSGKDVVVAQAANVDAVRKVDNVFVFDMMEDYVELVGTIGKELYLVDAVEGLERVRWTEKDDPMNFGLDGVSHTVYALATPDWETGDLNDLIEFYLEVESQADLAGSQESKFYGPFIGQLARLIQ